MAEAAGGGRGAERGGGRGPHHSASKNRSYSTGMTGPHFKFLSISRIFVNCSPIGLAILVTAED